MFNGYLYICCRIHVTFIKLTLRTCTQLSKLLRKWKPHVCIKMGSSCVQKCQNFNISWGIDPDPTWMTYSAPKTQDPRWFRPGNWVHVGLNSQSRNKTEFDCQHLILSSTHRVWCQHFLFLCYLTQNSVTIFCWKTRKTHLLLVVTFIQ